MNIIQDQLDINNLNITTDIIDETKADSLDIFEMIIDIENNFGIEIPDEDIKILRTPGDIIFYVQRILKTC
tara:strand:+ start:205 stop:417 length:213 start_codon:yes stop_codon:yes gene_type:complete